MKSIIDSEKKCYVCGVTVNLHLHHIMFGRNRKKADEDGLTVYLCYEHHEGTNGVHGYNGHNLDLELKKIAEKRWCYFYNKTTEQFIKRYGKNYLE